jgi:hypothetical protein
MHDIPEIRASNVRPRTFTHYTFLGTLGTFRSIIILDYFNL